MKTTITVEQYLAALSPDKRAALESLRAQIRSLLLAAVRAAVLWRQMGGSQLRLLMRRREYAMLARGLLARSTLDHG